MNLCTIWPLLTSPPYLCFFLTLLQPQQASSCCIKTPNSFSLENLAPALFFFFLKNPAPWSSHNWFLRVIQISGQVSFLQSILWPLNWVCLPVIFYHIILFYFCHILLLIYILRCSLSLSPSLLCEFHKSLFVSESSATKTMALSCTQKYMFINILPLSNN